MNASRSSSAPWLAAGAGVGTAGALLPPWDAGTIDSLLDKEYESKSFGELLKAPVSALAGVSEGDAQHLKDAFNIKTIRDLGTNKYFLWAQAFAKLAE